MGSEYVSVADCVPLWVSISASQRCLSRPTAASRDIAAPAAVFNVTHKLSIHQGSTRAPGSTPSIGVPRQVPHWYRCSYSGTSARCVRLARATARVAIRAMARANIARIAISRRTARGNYARALPLAGAAAPPAHTQPTTTRRRRDNFSRGASCSTGPLGTGAPQASLDLRPS